MTDWQTPPELFDPLNHLIHFQVDAAASGANHLLPEWYGPDSPISEDAFLVERWASPAWCNPPYGRGIQKWLEMFIQQQRIGGSVVALLPARVETRWWYELVVPYADIIFLVGRVPFIDPLRVKPSQPDHASALVFYTPSSEGKVTWSDWKEVESETQG